MNIYRNCILRVLFLFLLIVVAESATTCSSGKVLVTIVRTTQYDCYYEQLYIYKGQSSSQVYSCTYPNDYQVYTDSICLEPTLYTIKLSNNYSSGWRSGSNVVLSTPSYSIGTYTLPSGSYQQSYTFTISASSFEDTLITNWQFTNIPQSSTSWTTALLDWQTPSTFPTVTTTTRYFRSTYTIPDGEVYYAFHISISTNVGFRCYFNGEVLYDWNMPSGSITSSTYATGSTTTTVRTFSTLLSYLPQPINNKYFIAVEVHATSSTVSGAETFSASCKWVENDDVRINFAGAVTANPSGGISDSETPSSLFDGNISTKWCTSLTDVTLPIWAVYSIPSQGRELVNKYSVVSADSYPMRDCVKWNLYGSFSSASNWVLLDSRESIEWSARKQTKTFSLSNSVSYSHYKFECTQIASSSSTFFQMAEVTLYLSSNSGSTSNEPSYPSYSNSLLLYTPITITPLVYEPTTFTLIEGSLPQGLTLSNTTGVISGVPTVASTNMISIKATSSSTSTLLYLELTVISPPSSLSYPSSIQSLYINNEYTINPTFDGSSSTFSINSGSLPQGIILDTITGSIFGIPSTVGSYSVVIKAANEGGSTTVSLLFSVQEQPKVITYGEDSFILKKGDLWSISPQIVGNATSFLVFSGVLPQGLILNAETGVISGTPTQSTPMSTITIMAVVNNLAENAELSIQVLTQPGAFAYPEPSYFMSTGTAFTITPTIEGDSLTFSIISGTLPTGLVLDTNSGTISGIPSEATSMALLVKAENSVGSSTTSVTLTSAPAVSFFTYPNLNNILCTNTSTVITPTCNMEFTSFSIVQGIIPPGLSFDSTTGIISGTPSESFSSTSIIIRAVKQNLFVTCTISITVYSSPSALVYPQNQYTVKTGELFQITPTPNTGSVTYSIASGALPLGLQLNPYTGSISGIATEQYQIHSVVIKAGNSVGSSTFSIAMTVIAPPSSFSYPESAIATKVGTYVKWTPVFTCPNAHFEISNSSLPEGLTLNSNTGVISGTISQPMDSTIIEITVSNLGGRKTCEIVIHAIDAPSSFSYPETTYSLFLEESFTATPTIVGNASFRVKSGNFPNGLYLDENTGVISGIPTKELLSELVQIEAYNDAGSKVVQIVFSVKSMTWENVLLIVELIVIAILCLFLVVMVILYFSEQKKKVLPKESSETVAKHTMRVPHKKSPKKKETTKPVVVDEVKVEEIEGENKQTENVSEQNQPEEVDVHVVENEIGPKSEETEGQQS